jgi:hypothetical protein
MPGSEMTKGTIIVKGTVKDLMPVYQREGIEAVDGVEFTRVLRLWMAWSSPSMLATWSLTVRVSCSLSRQESDYFSDAGSSSI